ncbi:MAG: N-6 DNA methylase [Proteobacteria bacterium]|nr:N-6 DNA methylase [Pseudomonadota bacterium]
MKDAWAVAARFAAVEQARKVAEGGARHALEALAVHEPDPYRHMDEAQRDLRRKLRAQAKQLGDGESQAKRGAYEIKHLAEKLAYDQWHRLLFARYLLENNLLISPEHEVSVTLTDCEELAPSVGLKDAWAVAARFAAKELPEIFRADDPAGAVELSVNDRQPLVALVTDLPVEVFTASDSLGWCYQFWQAEKKDEVNAAGNKIGADELPAVTQLFTEDYMVDFLLDNTLGAWHACKVIAANPKLAEAPQSEDELRHAAALQGCPWKYLRFIKSTDGRWTPAAGAFEGWPKSARELKCLDPCMGSGHFVVAMFERLVALRLVEEKLDEATAVAAVIRDNLFGLEIDPRCTQIGAFNLALAAWRRVGHRPLPAMNLACSGLAPNTREADWLAFAGENEKLRNGMERLYRLFQKAAVLGSLINPRAGEGDLLEAGFHELQPLLEKALVQETKDDTAHEMAVTARGLAKAAEILAGQFTLVATNVPYLGRGKQDEELFDYCERVHPDAKADLATCFVERCLHFCASGGSTTLLTPQNWLFLGTYKKLRLELLKETRWNFLTRLGSQAFETIGGEVVNVVLLSLTPETPNSDATFAGLDVSDQNTPTTKSLSLSTYPTNRVRQSDQIANPDARIIIEALDQHPLLQSSAHSFAGIACGDSPRFLASFWEVTDFGKSWVLQQTAALGNALYDGFDKAFLWESGSGQFFSFVESLDGRLGGSWRRGEEAWGKKAVAVSRMSGLNASVYIGSLFDQSVSVILPDSPKHLAAILCYCRSDDFFTNVRKIDDKLNVTTATLAKVPFDLAHWQKVAAEKYPHGLPKPFSSDPTQWLFNGSPAGADQPLHVAVARLLGFQWPRQTGSSFPDCPALGQDGLEKLADDDGIVPISPTRGEGSAAERLREFLARTYGKDWNATRQEELLAQVDYGGASLEDWLRNGFFEQHCALFHHRPFIWHIWDGLKNGFSALVNYHKLTHANMEKLTYSTLGNWIQRQQAAVDAGEAGSDAKLQAAKQLQAKLKLILDGEPPYDIFVRWKSLAQQPIGWHPDLNDGVRMNIRPFATADILRKRVKIKWDKDRGKEPVREKKEFPWFWGWDDGKQDFAGVGKEPDGNRWNDCHYTNDFKNTAREASKKR